MKKGKLKPKTLILQLTNGSHQLKSTVFRYIM